MKKIGKAVFAVTLALAAPSCFAQGMLNGPESAWYVAASIGESNVENVCNAAVLGTCDSRDTAYRVFGGMQFNRYLAVELGYQRLGKLTDNFGTSTTTIKSDAYDLSAVGLLPLTDSLSGTGRLGVYNGTSKISTNPNVGLNQSFDSTGMTFGVGLQYDINKNMALRGEWAQYSKMGGGALLDFNINVLSIAGIWHFK